MRKRLIVFTILLPSLAYSQTLKECQQAAEQNYPLIRQYELIEKTTALTVTNIQKGWLPQISASAQATYQSDVAAFPDQMKGLYQQMGLDLKGLAKDQYRVGVDINQTIYDGGAINSQKTIAREQGKVQAAQNEVGLYQVRKRVNEMYFSLLLLDEQLRLNKDLQELLVHNEKKLSSMVKNGTAAESDLLNVQAERLNAIQQATNLESQKQMLVRMLSTFCGMEVKDPQKARHTCSCATAGRVCRCVTATPVSSPGTEGPRCPTGSSRCPREGAGCSFKTQAWRICPRFLWLPRFEYVRGYDAPRLES